MVLPTVCILFGPKALRHKRGVGSILAKIATLGYTLPYLPYHKTSSPVYGKFLQNVLDRNKANAVRCLSRLHFATEGFRFCQTTCTASNR